MQRSSLEALRRGTLSAQTFHLEKNAGTTPTGNARKRIASRNVRKGGELPMKVLDAHRADRLQALCEWIVPGSARVGPVVYVDAVLAARPPEARAEALRAIDALSDAASAQELARHERTPEFGLVRALAIEAYYSDFVAPGREGPGAWAEIDFQPPRAVDLERDWSYLGIDPA